MKDVKNTEFSIYEDETLCDIYTDEHTGNKMIHLLGYYFPADGDKEKPLRKLEYTNMNVPIKEALNYQNKDGTGVKAWEDDVSSINTQYCEDITYETLKKEIKKYPVVRYSELSENMCDGRYFLQPEHSLRDTGPVKHNLLNK